MVGLIWPTTTHTGRAGGLVDAGYCVVHVNYRGSAGYGSAWRDALEGRPGLTEWRTCCGTDWVVGHHPGERAALRHRRWFLVDISRCSASAPARIYGPLARGRPDREHLAAYDEEMEPLRSFDRAIFGGSPEEVRRLRSVLADQLRREGRRAGVDPRRRQ